MRINLILFVIFSLGSISNTFAHTLIGYAHRDVANRSQCDSKARLAIKKGGYKLTYASSVRFTGKKGKDMVVSISCDIADRANIAFIIVSGQESITNINPELNRMTTFFDTAR